MAGTLFNTAIDETVAPEVDDALALYGLDRAAEDVQASMAAEDAIHGWEETAHILRIDPVPRVFEAEEWSELADGLAQRVRALEAFLRDAAGPRHAFADGVVPHDLLDGSEWFETAALALPPQPVRIGIAGPDIVRDAHGDLVVLEDNTRTPTLQAYALAARRAVQRVVVAGPRPRPIEGPLRALLHGMARAAAPEVAEPVVAILGRDPGNYVLWEIEELGRLTGWPVVAIGDLRADGDRVVLPDGRKVDLLWRRTSAELLSDVGRPLHRALLSGELRVVNAFGCGAADDKRTYPYVEDLVRYFCGEEPLIHSVPSYDLGNEEHRAEALDRLDELVLKPRGGCGGVGVTLGPRATRAEMDRVREAIEADPAGWVAQELVALSTHPTVIDGRLEPRHVDLRPAVVAAPDGGYDVMPGGLSRFAPEAGDLVVNCSQGGGGKDVWILN
jgi:uncharacterized circularly permuted ATP-grasp superfamily protein